MTEYDKENHDDEIDIKICTQCFYISEPSNIFVCPYCGHIESVAGKMGYNLTILKTKLHILDLGIYQLKNYTLPSFTLLDHLVDCFECLCWWIEPRRETVLSPYTQAMINIFNDNIPTPGPLLTIVDGSKPFISGEEIEIDIVRGWIS